MPQIIWTVLPNGGDSQVFKASLYVSLRLDTGTLDASLTTNFAQTIQSLSSVALQFDDGSLTSVPFTIDKTLLTPSLWDQIFPADTAVVARTLTDISNRHVISYPVDVLTQTVRALYKDTAERYGLTPPPPPSAQDQSSNLFQLVSTVGNEFSNYEKPAPGGGGGIALSAATPSPGLPPVSALPQTSEFYQAHRFYKRDLNGAPDNPSTDVQIPTLDFHQALAMLGDHPDLLRRLGLIIDGTFARSALPSGATRVRFVASNGSDRTPWTRFTVGSSGLLALPASTSDVNDTDLSQGFVKLGDALRFNVHQFDTDSAGLKLGQYAANQFATITQVNAEPRTAEIPTLRTAGIIVSRKDRGARLTTRLGRAFALDTMTATDGFFADDLLRGYRLDVRNEADGVWRSLSLRHGSWLVGPSQVRVPAQGDVHDEGFTKASGATSDDTTSDTKPLYVHERLFSWDGWSKVASTPGKSLVFDKTAAQHETVQQVSNVPKTPFKVQPQFNVEPGTLPKLRFGQTYRLRARSVDLAGNSVPLSTPLTDTTLMSAPVVFQRHEPVPQPTLVLRRPLVEGESLEHIVVRTQSGHPQNAGNVFFPTNDRFVAPPTTSLDNVIMHGKLDPLFGSPQAAYNLALKSEGTFLDTSIWDPILGIKVPVLGIQVVNSPGIDPSTPTVFPTNRGDGLAPGQYVIHTEPILTLPYLPDPLAAGFALTDARDAAHQTAAVGTQKYAFVGGWPSVIPAKINVRTTVASAPSVVAELDGLTVYLPPATILPLNLSSTLPQGSLGTFAVWSLMASDKQTALQQPTLNGQHWMFTPRRQVIAVNAVERPLSAASFTTLAVQPARKAGETFVKLAGVVSNHSHSTGQLDIEAAWTDRVDRLTDPGPTDEPHTGHVSSYRPAYEESSATIPPVGTTDPQDLPKHDFGDTKHRLVQYRADATTRYREYFPPSVTSISSNIVFPGVTTQINVLASDRPKAPEVLYIVPTFRWDTNVNPGLLAPTNATSNRVGRALRVYLSRPWYSSGEGEQLAVVLVGVTGPSDAARKYFSEWGADPIWNTTAQGPLTELAPSNFTNAAVTTPNTLVLAEDPSIQVQAVAFNVQYNASRKVWYADVEMSAVTSYFPFVRLALARYQPNSVKGVELSPVVKTDFVQLVNDRSATLQFAGPLNSSVKVSVHGVAAHNRLGDAIALLPPTGPTPTPPSGFKFDAKAGAGRVVTAQIEQVTIGQSDLEWTPVGGPTILPSFTATSNPGTEVMWSGTVPIAPRPLNVLKRRVVLREIELFATDPDTTETVLVQVPSGASVRGRVAYLDVIPFTDLDLI